MCKDWVRQWQLLLKLLLAPPATALALAEAVPDPDAEAEAEANAEAWRAPKRHCFLSVNKYWRCRRFASTGQ